MKFYVAGKFEKKDQIHQAFKEVKKLGHSISYDWTTHKYIKPYIKNQKQASIYSQNEVRGISECDIFVYFAEETGHTLPMEFGGALLLAKKTGKPKIYAIGKYNSLSPWFFNPLVKRTDSFKKVLKELVDTGVE